MRNFLLELKASKFGPKETQWPEVDLYHNDLLLNLHHKNQHGLGQ